MKNKKKLFLFSALSLIPIITSSVVIGLSSCSSNSQQNDVNKNNIVLNYYQFFDFKFNEFKKICDDSKLQDYAKSVIVNKVYFLNENDVVNSKILTTNNQIILTNALVENNTKNIVFENKDIFNEKNEFNSTLINGSLQNSAFNLFNLTFNNQNTVLNLNYNKPNQTQPPSQDAPQQPSFVFVPIPYKVVFNDALKQQQCFLDIKKQIETKLNSESVNLKSLFETDVDFIIYNFLVNNFNKWATPLLNSNLYYAKNLTFSVDNKINGNIYLQFKNNTKTNQIVNFLDINETLQPDDFITFKFNFNNAVLDLFVFNFENKNTLGFKVLNSNIEYQINSNEIKNTDFKIEKSYTISSSIQNASVKNNIYTDKLEIEKLILNITSQPNFINDFKNNFIVNLKKDFEILKQQIISVVEILEILNNDKLTLKQFLQSLGNPLYGLVEKLNPNLANILKNLFSDQKASSFLYNSFDSIMLFIDSIKNDQNRETLDSIQNFLKENLENKPESVYIDFIKNLPALKDTIISFLLATNFFNPEQLSLILLIVDDLSKDNNIFEFLVNNLDNILLIFQSLFSTNIPIYNLIKSIQIWFNSFKPNILEQDFWTLLLTKNQDYENIIKCVKELNPTIGDILEGLYILFTKKPQNKQAILKFLTSILGQNPISPNPNFDSIKPTFDDPAISTLKQYIQKHFIFVDNSQNLNLTLSNNWLVNGLLKYDFVFDSKATFNLNPLKELIGVQPKLNSKQQSNQLITISSKTNKLFGDSSTSPQPQQSQIVNIISNLDKILSKFINKKTSVVISPDSKNPKMTTSIKNTISLNNEMLLPTFKDNFLFLSSSFSLEQDFSKIWFDVLSFLTINKLLPSKLTTPNLNYLSSFKLSNKHYDYFDTNLINFSNKIVIDQKFKDFLNSNKQNIWKLLNNNKPNPIYLNYSELLKGNISEITQTPINYLDLIVACEINNQLLKKIKLTIKSPINILIDDKMQTQTVDFKNIWSVVI